MKPYQCLDPFDWQAILTLIQTEFAFMEGRIDPPSSMHRLTLGTISDHAQTGEIWAIGPTPIACVFLTPKPDALYVGKLAVATSHRRHGLARLLIDLAATRARAMRLPMLELQTRERVGRKSIWRAKRDNRTLRHVAYPFLSENCGASTTP